jgi:hydroxymethylglutaryl-CoA lyase
VNLPAKMHIIEVGLRDGLQAEATIIPTAQKLRYIEQLIDAGIRRIQVGSFVHPTKVPQMADTDALCQQLEPLHGIDFSGLVLNAKGLERLSDAGLRAVDMGISVSDTHSIKNTGQPVAVKLAEMLTMIDRARELGLVVRAGVQCVFGCVYEGAIDPQKVVDIVRQYMAQGIDELSLADSTGMANPKQIADMLTLIKPIVGDTPIVLHLHDTRGLGLANALTAVQHGVIGLDTAFGGLGGCPFIQGATGNIATEDTVNMLEAMGVTTGVDLKKVAQVSQHIAETLGKPLNGKLYRIN